MEPEISVVVPLYNEVDNVAPLVQQVLSALCEGLRVKEIAAKLEIGDETVRSHVKRLKAKTGCAGIVDIVNQVSRLPPMVGALRQAPVETTRGDERA